MPKEQREKDRQSASKFDKKTSKNGGGGKYTWGTEGCEINDFIPNENDPNYEQPQKEENTT